MLVNINETNNEFILSKEEQEMIIDKFPEKLKPFLSQCNNPLDETQVLVNLFKDKDVRIVLRQEENEFGDIEWVSYYHCQDLAKEVKFDPKHIDNWKKLWQIKMITYENLLPNYLGAKIIELNKRRTEKNSNFVGEQELKKVIIKINTPEAKLFQEWILRQATIMKSLVKTMIKIKHQQELEELKQQLNKPNKELIKRTSLALQYFPNPIRKSGEIYLATSDLFIKEYKYKIGLTETSLAKRQSSLQTSNPDIKIIYHIQCKDVVLAETIIHNYLDHLHPQNF